MSPRRFALAAIAAVFMFVPSIASAGVTVDGTGEPRFTKSTQNTQWITWQAPAGTDEYRLIVSYYRDGQLFLQPSPFPAALSDTVWINWSGVATLEEGRSYEICVQGQYQFINDSLWFPDGPNSCDSGEATGKRTETTIDRTKPTISVELADGAESTLGPSVPLSVTYQDATSPPFPGNFLCVLPGTGANVCDGATFGESAQCSVPAANLPSTTFDCTLDVSAIDPDDGLLFACVRSADSAHPDNPASSNQSSNPGQANLSDRACDSIDLLNAACEAAKAKLAKAKARLKRLREANVPGKRIKKAKANVKNAKVAVAEACV